MQGFPTMPPMSREMFARWCVHQCYTHIHTLPHSQPIESLLNVRRTSKLEDLLCVCASSSLSLSFRPSLHLVRLCCHSLPGLYWSSYFLFIFNQKAGKLCCLIDESLREAHHWLPQNQLSFIFNKILLIIRAPLNAMHCLYTQGVRQGKQRQQQGERRRMWGGKNGQNERRSVSHEKQKGRGQRFWARGRTGWHLSPLALIHVDLSPFHHLSHLHHITRFLSPFSSSY